MLAEAHNEPFAPVTENCFKLELEPIIESSFPEHPFTNIASDTQYEIVLANYLAMSQAFPFLQAGSQKDLIFHYMERNQDVPEHVELTSVVGNFLCWDETGGLYPTIAMGLKALPRILETRRFHANLLKTDCENLFGKKIQPHYSDITKTYLTRLFERLASLSPITRVACMVSFENHANRMISELWDSISARFNVAKKDLIYFAMHVGGEDPAEAYHVEMTNSLINKTVANNQIDEFIVQFKEAYSLHVNWCRDVILAGQ